MRTGHGSFSGHDTVLRLPVSDPPVVASPGSSVAPLTSCSRRRRKRTWVRKPCQAPHGIMAKVAVPFGRVTGSLIGRWCWVYVYLFSGSGSCEHFRSGLGMTVSTVFEVRCGCTDGLFAVSAWADGASGLPDGVSP